jgi:hypothetical protein
MPKHPLQNAAQGVIGGAIGSGLLVQGTITTGASVSTQQQSFNQAVMANRRVSTTNKRMHLHVDIEQAGNGYIVGFAGSYGEIIDKQVAVNLEQVQQLIASEMASRMLEESK